MAMGDPAKEPGNPDGCKMDKKKISKMASSLANLADMFSRAATLIESAVNSIAGSIKKIGRGAGGKEGEGKASGGKIELPFNMKAWEATRKKNISNAKKQEATDKKYYDSMLSAAEDSILAAEKAGQAKIEAANKEEIQARIDGLNVKKYSDALKKKKQDAADAKIEAANKEKIQARIDGLNVQAFSKALADKRKEALEKEEKATEEKIKLLEDFQKRQAIQLEKFKKEEEAALKAKEDAANAEFIEAKILGLQVQAYSKALKDQEKRRQDEEQAARDAESNARKKFFADQEKDIMRQAPIAYSIGKALGFITGSLFQAVSGLFSKGNKGPQGKATGGWIQAFASGGAAKGTDTVPAMLTPGEFVVNKKSAQKNRGILKSINDGTQYYAAGGYVGAMSRGVDATRRGAGAAIGGATAGLEAAGISSLTGGLQALNAVVGAAATGFKVLTASALAPVDMFNKLTSFAGSFVEAVNPALMQQLSLAFKDLQAIIGVGLQPVIAAAVPIIRAFADKLQPVMQALMPTFDQLAQSMIQLSGPVITLLIEGFAALEPVISIVSMAVQVLADVLTAIAPIISTVFKEIIFRVTSLATTLQWLIGKMISWIPGTGDTGKKLMESADAAQKTADMYYAGASQVQKAVKEPVKKGASVGAAAQSASFKGISDFGKGLMQAAFSSSTQAAALKTAEYSEKTYNELANMNARMGRVNPAAPAAGVRRAGP